MTQNNIMIGTRLFFTVQPLRRCRFILKPLLFSSIFLTTVFSFRAVHSREIEGVTGVGAGLSIDVEYIRPTDQVNAYAVKFICGETALDHPLVRAIYRTEISTFNPRDDQSISYQWRAGFVFPSSPPATDAQEVIRGPFRGQEINCRDITRAIERTSEEVQFPEQYNELLNAPLLKGFILINSSDDALRVSGVYTTLHKQVHGNKIIDLLPIKFCRRTTDNQALLVTLKNEGEASSPETQTSLQFEGFSEVLLETPSIIPGEEITLDPVPIPGNPQVFAYTVSADAVNIVDESNENNNEANVQCEFSR